MTPEAPTIAAVTLSVAALLGLAAVQGSLDPIDGLSRRFRFALRVAMAIFAGRALFVLTDAWTFQVLTLIAAALVPLAVLILAEGLLRRHAPRALKAIVAIGTLIATALAFAPETGRWWLLSFHILGLLAAGLLVATRDRASLSPAENRTAMRLGLSLILIVPLAATDFVVDRMGLPVQVAALAVLVLCWLAVGLGQAGAARGLVIATLAALAGAGLIAAMVGLDGQEAFLVGSVALACALAALVLIQARVRAEDREANALLRLLAEGPAEPEAFVAALRAVPALGGGVVLGPADLADLDAGILARVFHDRPVLRRADLTGSGETAEHAAHLFDRTGASHLMMINREPLTILALALPALGATARGEWELRAAQRLALALRESDHG